MKWNIFDVLRKSNSKMSFSLAKNIAARMRAKNLTISDVNKAGRLKDDSVRKILNCTSKRPSSRVLSAIADALQCDIKDLLTEDPISEDTFFRDRLETLANRYQHKRLLMDTVDAVHQKLEEAGKKTTIKQYMSYIEEVYLHSLEKDPSKVDMDYLEWFVGLIEDRNS